MNSKVVAILCAFALTLATPVAHAGDVLDRIVATVNGQAIFQSDWDDAVLYEAFVAKRSVDAVSFAERKAALDHLIDQELLQEQIHGVESVEPTEQEVAKQIDDIRKQYDGSEVEAAWKTLLSNHKLTEQELRRRVKLQLKLARLVDLRLRPSANVTPKNIESYYQHELLPQLQESGARQVTLAEVSLKIKELLTEKKINELLVAWLQDLHSGSDIRTHFDSSFNESQPQ
jgi:hypothetical protein